MVAGDLGVGRSCQHSTEWAIGGAVEREVAAAPRPGRQEGRVALGKGRRGRRCDWRRGGGGPRNRGRGSGGEAPKVVR
ncbi:UNVERIFIED_CONTAM: hypothetical protein Sangu_1167100 [Sesamum angustifolium]|uniref:Uncharacterized protein n=1 Tax=Sesamum angustifolium TaxID=2727405 RepID=A0AAW2P1J3_9LAMI